MPTVNETIDRIVDAPSWNQRITQIRLIPQNHGTGEHPRIYAEIARQLYLPHLAPDFAYIHEARFYGEEYFQEVFSSAVRATDGFTLVSENDLAKTLEDDPRTLLVFRTILGLTREEFAQSTTLAGKAGGLRPLTPGKVDSMERHGARTEGEQAFIAARTLIDLCISNRHQGHKKEGNLEAVTKESRRSGRVLAWVASRQSSSSNSRGCRGGRWQAHA